MTLRKQLLRMLENAILDAFLMVIVSGELEHVSLSLYSNYRGMYCTEIRTVQGHVLYRDMYCTETCTVQRHVLYRDMYCTKL